MNPPRPMPPSRPLPPPIRYEIVHRIALDPEVIELLVNIFTPEPAMKEQELVDLLTGFTADVKSLLDAEHGEVMAAFEALKNGDVPPALSDAVQALIDVVKGGIPKILDVVTAPADGGTMTPVPGPAPAGGANPVPTPADGSTAPGGGGTPVPSTVAP